MYREAEHGPLCRGMACNNRLLCAACRVETCTKSTYTYMRRPPSPPVAPKGQSGNMGRKLKLEKGKGPRKGSSLYGKLAVQPGEVYIPGNSEIFLKLLKGYLFTKCVFFQMLMHSTFSLFVICGLKVFLVKKKSKSH